MIKPRKLQPGDKVAVVTLSWGGPGSFPPRYEAGKKQLQDEFGLTVVEAPHALRSAEWLVYNPEARADDLMWAFSDPSIRGIFSPIGGDDSIRLLPHLDLQVIQDNPKVLMGFSDTTITHLACFRAGLGSFYGPSIMAGFAENGGLFPYMVDSVRRTLFSAEAIGELRPNTSGWTSEAPPWGDPANQAIPRKLRRSTGWRWLQAANGGGVRRGRLIGGCIEVLDWLRGTDFWPPLAQWQDAILFLETSEDKPTPEMLRCYLRDFAALDVLPRLSGIWFARPYGRLSQRRHEEYDQALLDIVSSEEGLHDLPIIANMDFGHTDPVFVIPYGVTAEIDCAAQRISILECGVVD